MCLFLVLFFSEHMAAAIVVSALLQQFKALPAALVGPWVLGSLSLLFFFALVSQLQITKNAFYWHHSSNVCGFVQQVMWERVPKFAECVYFCKKMQQVSAVRALAVVRVTVCPFALSY